MTINNRVVVTGVGVMTPIGCSVDAYWNNLISGKSGFTEISRFDTSSYQTRIAGQIDDDFLCVEAIGGKRVRALERVALLGLKAAEIAIADSGLNERGDLLKESGVIIGSGVGGMMFYENQISHWLSNGSGRVHPTAIARITPNTVSSNIAINLGCSGVDLTISTACSSSSHAIGVASMFIKNGLSSRVITGGAEAPIAPVLFAAFDNMRVMSSDNHDPDKACRPFDAKRNGFVLSEGAAILVLENRIDAIKRNAKIYAEICGYGQSSGGHHMIIPAPDGVGEARAMESAMQMANVNPQQIDYISAHGTGTIANDKSETLAIKKALRDTAYLVPISSIKGQTGHLIGASGALSCVTSLLSIVNGTVIPNKNLSNKDPLCDLNYISKPIYSKRINYAIVNSFGFGNNNASIVIGRGDHE